MHYGTKGMKRGQHDPNKRWQSHAVYAQGKPNPNAKVRGKKEDRKLAGADYDGDTVYKAPTGKSVRYPGGWAPQSAYKKTGTVAAGIKSGVKNAASAVKKEVTDYHRAKTPKEIKQFIGKLDQRYSNAKGNVSKFGLKAEKTMATIKLGKQLRRPASRYAGTVAGAASAAATMKVGSKVVAARNMAKQFAYLHSKGINPGFIANSFLTGPGLPQVNLISPSVVPALSGAMFALGVGIDTGLSYRRGRRELNS